METEAFVAYKQGEYGFNGATTFQSWKLLTRFQIPNILFLLQWSHDFSVMETGVPSRQVMSLMNASMEPRLFSHGNGGRFCAVGEYSAFSSTSAHHPHG